MHYIQKYFRNLNILNKMHTCLILFTKNMIDLNNEGLIFVVVLKDQKSFINGGKN